MISTQTTIAYQLLEKETRNFPKVYPPVHHILIPGNPFATHIELEGKKESTQPGMGPCAGVLWSTYFYFRYSPTEVRVFSGAVYKVTVRNKPRRVC